MKNKGRILLPLFIFIFCFVTSFSTQGQFDKSVWKGSAALLNDAASLPFAGKAGIVHLPIHPGGVVAVERNWTSGPKFQWSQTAKIGYINHRYLQHILQLYTELQANYRLQKPWMVYAGLGLGYAHAFTNHHDKFELQENGTYKKKANVGRAQAMFGLNLGSSLNVGQAFERNVAVFMNYHMWFQMPFVNQYVPLLPHSTLQIGLKFNFHSKDKNESGEEYF